MRTFSLQNLILVPLCLSWTLQLSAQPVSLPEPAIPGLRYYYPPESIQPRTIKTDVCIYGGTCAGVIAAVQADRMGKDVVLLEFGKHLGGLSSGGLSHTDGGDPSVCGGIAREFYNLIGQHSFRPSAAEEAFEKLLAATQVKVYKRAHLDKVEKAGTRIVSITMEDGLTVQAEQFIDTTYEGDLLARAGVAWDAGREANSLYSETYNGIRTPGLGGHNWPTRVDPYRVAGEPNSGLLPRVNDSPGKPGDGDERIQAFCFRMWLTKDNPLPIPKPTIYDEVQYELLARLFESGADPKIRFSLDTNNHHLFNGAYFIDFVGGNYNWPDASWLEREQIFQDHANYQIGVMWFLNHSERIPEPYRSEIRQWGLPRDEYIDTSGWSHQLYIREGRRMLGDYVMTQANCQGTEVPTDSVGLASYNMDSHHCQMTVVDGAVKNEGNVEIPVNPYPISYRALIPRRAECTNLLVPVALSSTHIAFGSIRMEPVFMLLGQSAATAAVLAIDSDAAVQDVDYSALRQRLLDDKQILEYTGPLKVRTGQNIINASNLPGLVVDDTQAELQGPWSVNHVTSPRVGETYLHDGNAAKGECSARYVFPIAEPGQFEVRISWPPNPNRATNVPVTIQTSAGESTTVLVNQKTSGKDGFNAVGAYRFTDAAVITISNADTDGFVIADAVQLIPANAPAVAPASSLPSNDVQGNRRKALECIAPVKADAPNFLFLFADDLGYETLGCYGGKEFSTPNLDRLASQGTRFARAYTSPVCTPSRMSLYTGNYPSHHGYYNVLPVHLGTKEAVDFANRWNTYPQILRAAGYQTSVTGKWQLATLEFHPQHCRDAGFDSWCVWQIWRQGAKTTRHWNPTLNHDGMVRDDIAERFGPDVLADYVIEQMKTAVASKRPFYIHHNMLLPHEPVVETPADRERRVAPSLPGMIAYMDSLCGRIIRAVDELGIAEETYIIFMGDNGTDLMKVRQTVAGAVRGGKRDLNDAGTHVPLVVRCPGKVPSGVVVEDLVDSTDWFPTFCELAGTAIPSDIRLDGVSFAGRLHGGAPSERTFVVGGYGGDISIYDGSWRLNMNKNVLIDARNLPREELVLHSSPDFESQATRLRRIAQEVLGPQ